MTKIHNSSLTVKHLAASAWVEPTPTPTVVLPTWPTDMPAVTVRGYMTSNNVPANI